MTFSKKEYETFFHFFNEIRVPVSYFRKKIQLLLQDLFDYNLSIFWLADEEGNLYNPEFFNYSDQFIDEYVDRFFQYDILNPQNLKSTFSGSPVLRIKDVIRFSQYEKSEFYSMFKCKHNYYDGMIVYLKDEERLCGAIGLTRSKEEKHFTTKDCQRLHFLSTHISHLLTNYIRMEDINYQKKMFETITNVSETGMILVSDDHRILFVNDTARLIVREFNKGSTSIEDFLSHYVFKRANWKFGLNFKISSVNKRQLNIRVIPELEGILSNHRCQYGIYLSPEKETIGNETIEQRLSVREMEICFLVKQGCTNEQISEKLWISINTVKKHLRNIYEKLEVNNRTSLAYKLNDV